MNIEVITIPTHFATEMTQLNFSSKMNKSYYEAVQSNYNMYLLLWKVKNIYLWEESEVILRN